MERAHGVGFPTGFPACVCTNDAVGRATLTYFDVVVLDEKLDALKNAALRLLLAAVVARRLVLDAEFVGVHVDLAETRGGEGGEDVSGERARGVL